MEVRKVEKEWKIWDKEEEAEKLIPKRFYK